MTEIGLPDLRLVIAQPCELWPLVDGLDIDGFDSPPSMMSIPNDAFEKGTKGFVVGFHGTGFSSYKGVLSEDTMERILSVHVQLENGKLMWFWSRTVKGL